VLTGGFLVSAGFAVDQLRNNLARIFTIKHMLGDLKYDR
jgi:hypothetical protein